MNTADFASGDDLTGRVALVTGASRGLGAAMAMALARAGASVIGWARHAGRLRRIAAAIEEEAVACGIRHSLQRPQLPLWCPPRSGQAALVQQVDVTDARAVRRAVAQALRRFGRLDILVNNAGIWGGEDVSRLGLGTWSRVLATDLTGAFVVSQAVLPTMIRRRYGKIIHISSTSGLIAHPHGAAYGTAKAGLIHLTRIMAVELGRYGVRVNAIAPGTCRTDMTADVFADRAWVTRRKKRIPLGRFGEPHDLDGLVVFLASRGSDFITGQTIVIDGGAMLAV